MKKIMIGILGIFCIFKISSLAQAEEYYHDGYGEVKISLQEGGLSPVNEISKIVIDSYYDILSGQGDITADGHVYIHGKKEIKESGDHVKASWGDNSVLINYSLTEGGTGQISIETEHSNQSNVSGSSTIDNVDYTGSACAKNQINVNYQKNIETTENYFKEIEINSSGIAVTWQSADGKNYGAEVSSRLDANGLCLTDSINRGQVQAESNAANGADYAKAGANAGYNLDTGQSGYARVDTFTHINTWDGGKYAKTQVSTSVGENTSK